MTVQVGNHGLFCLDQDDYAAFALAMQCNAEAIDATLTAQAAQLNSFIDRPYSSTVNTNSVTVVNGSGFTGPEGRVGAALRPAGIGSTTVSSTFNGITNTTGGWPLGFYLIGTSVNWTVAAPTNNSSRVLLVYGVDTIAGVTDAASTYTDLYLSTDYEGTTGNNGALTVVGMLENIGNLNTIQSTFTHSNVGNLVIPVSGWKLWSVYLGTGRVI